MTYSTLDFQFDSVEFCNVNVDSSTVVLETSDKAILLAILTIATFGSLIGQKIIGDLFFSKSIFCREQ